jgi:hypothetical protein
VEQEAADEFMGLKDHSLFPIAIFAIPIAQQDFSLFDLQNTVIGESDAVGVAAEVVKNGARRPERLFPGNGGSAWPTPPSRQGKTSLSSVKNGAASSPQSFSLVVLP